MIIVAPPFDQVLKIYEFDLNIRNSWYNKPYTKPALFEMRFYLKSFSQKTLSQGCGASGFFCVFLSISTSSSSQLSLRITNSTSWDSTTVPDIYNVQAVVFILNEISKNTFSIFNFLTTDYYPLNTNTLGPSQFNINPSKYGSDINKKCILGFYDMEAIRINQPTYRFDLDPTLGVVDKL